MGTSSFKSYHCATKQDQRQSFDKPSDYAVCGVHGIVDEDYKVFCDMTPYQLVTSSRRFSPLFSDSSEDRGSSCLRNVVNSLLIDMVQCHRGL
jgi:hypothetical protein